MRKWAAISESKLCLIKSALPSKSTKWTQQMIKTMVRAGSSSASNTKLAKVCDLILKCVSSS